MKLKKTIKIGKAIIDIWEDGDGSMVIGGFGWYEYFDYMNKVDGREIK